MDPISAAVLAAITKLAEPAVKDAYGGLKELLKRKFGAHSDVVTAVTSLEQKPDSGGRRETLREEVAAINAAADQELLAAARALLERVQGAPGGTVVTQQVTGNQNVFSGTGNVTATDRRV
jgi:hypothetical protein